MDVFGDAHTIAGTPHFCMMPPTMRGFRWLVLCFALLSFLTGCGEGGSDAGAGAVGSHHHVARTNGSAVVLSYDERIAVMTMRSAGVVSIFKVNPKLAGKEKVSLLKELDTGEGSEPWAAVIGADDDTAYILLRGLHQVVRITSLHTAPTLDKLRAEVESEPTDIAISPSGNKLFVANWGEGTINTITADPFKTRAAADLNSVLLAKGTALGELATRSGLAHPYALAVTDNGDDDDTDETLYATEFFSQSLPGIDATSDFSEVDQNRQGYVYTMSLSSGNPGPMIAIAPVANTGFADSEKRMTGCFPNQLYGAAIDGGRLYVTAMCASPRGPLGVPKTDATDTSNFKTLVHPAVFVIDTASNAELPANGRLLTKVLQGYLDDGESPAGARMPLIPNEIEFGAALSGDGRSAYVSALGADAVFRLDYDAKGTLRGIGSPGKRFIDVATERGLPVGVAVSQRSEPGFALAANDTAQRLTVIETANSASVSVSAAPTNPRAVATLDSPANYGRAHFATGLDVWSFKGQAWSSCESCHPGGLSDGVTWFFARGPRRTLSTANTYDKIHTTDERQRRLLLWGANIDEIHDVEAITRTVSGGVGGVSWAYVAGPPDNFCRLLYDGGQPATGGMSSCDAQKHTTFLQNGLNGSLASVTTGALCTAGAECNSGVADWNEIDAFIRSLRAPQRLMRFTDEAIEAGRHVFDEGRCAGCHGGPNWTVSTLFYTPGEKMNALLPYTPPDVLPDLGLLRSGNYQVPDALLRLNPPGASGSAHFRPAPAESNDATAFVYSQEKDDKNKFGGVWGNDQLSCALRDVGTFPAQPNDTTQPINVAGITPKGAPAVLEYRQDMKTLAQGKNGMSVPSLFGLSVGAPFFHAGNARTLEELFDPTFAAHYQALAPDFLGQSETFTRSDRIAELIAFLLSIDENTTPPDLLNQAADGSALNHDLCRP